MSNKTWNVYLSGEIHSDWRDQIMEGSKAIKLPVTFTGPVTDHDASDLCGVKILGEETQQFWQDRKGAGINAIRTSSLISQADIVIVRFGAKFKQWNAAFDAGYAAALNKPLIIMHEEEHNHALKEVDAAANATARSPDQIVDILAYVING
ncbi:MAG: hypothetical protein CMD52_01005 [Gammaproteobacteria bacterium]|jgi:YtoQ family protein|nr:hypothetical protein [Gammaproteobacteria bacterium]MBD08878.1 hypothetical protein [Gammaproteobacteria bacterium]MDC3267236.1 YtoQ family protein [Gammaproteobacteria bacterium]|tara:strand:+ start:4139 stop:4591 length:453 start_codon:yes stop_codon:yes gene_type:complete